MDDAQISSILHVIKIILYGTITIGACLYAVPLFLVRRFHKPLHLLTLNVCIAVIACSIFTTVYITMDTYYPRLLWSSQSCLRIIYLQNMIICSVNYAFCSVSLNRLFTVVYKNKALFRTKRWAGICACLQWIVAIVLLLPILSLDSFECLMFGLALNYRIYLFIVVVIMPALCLVLTNISIFMYAYRSTRRVVPTNHDGTQVTTLNQRDSRLLKHIMFMFTIFFGSLAPIYIMMIVLGTGVIISPVVVRGLGLLSGTGLLIDVIDLFLYNHELRKYLTNRRQMQALRI